MDKWRQEGFPVVPANRLADDVDIAEAFLYLASDAAKYVSGVNLVVDGALTPRPTTSRTTETSLSRSVPPRQGTDR